MRRHFPVIPPSSAEQVAGVIFLWCLGLPAIVFLALCITLVPVLYLARFAVRSVWRLTHQTVRLVLSKLPPDIFRGFMDV